MVRDREGSVGLRPRLRHDGLAIVWRAVGIVAVPFVLTVAIFAVVEFVDRPIPHRLFWALIIGVVLLLALAGGYAVRAVIALVDEISDAAGEVARRARLIGDATGARIEPVHTGIIEFDEVIAAAGRGAAEMTLRLANEREFASDASHQLRTPLTALSLRLEEISMSDDPERMREEARIAIDQVERLTRVVDDLLRRSRATPAEKVPVITVDSVLARLQREWQPSFQVARRSIKISGERGLRVLAAPDALAQIVSTLLENSLKHGAGRVEVLARHSGPSVVLEVTDQGPGVDPPLAAHIFERHVTTGGTGLGLALARDLAQANGGRLELLQAYPPLFAVFMSEAPAE